MNTISNTIQYIVIGGCILYVFFPGFYGKTYYPYTSNHSISIYGGLVLQFARIICFNIKNFAVA